MIGSVFLAPQHRDLQHIEHSVGEFMQAGVEQGTHQSVDRRDTSRCRFEGDGLPELVYIFITHYYHVVFI